MKRSDLNFSVDLMSFMVLSGLAFTGAIMKYVLPPGTGGRWRLTYGGGEHIKTFLAMGRHDWGDIHFWLAVSFVVLMLIHIVLHFGWVKNYCKNSARESLKYSFLTIHYSINSFMLFIRSSK